MKDKNNIKILDETQMPTFPKEWLHRLQYLYPDQCPHVDWPERRVWMSVGSRQVVQYLEEQYANQHRSS